MQPVPPVPSVMGTQHPDNVSPVPFGDSPRVGRDLEGEEVLYNIAELGMPEIMIDYERKHGEATPLWDWLHRCPTCLEERVIGRDFRVTPRLPNPDADRDDPYFWQGLGIFPNSVLVMGRMGLQGPAFTEFIIPDAARGRTLARIELHLVERWRLLRAQYAAYADETPIPWDGAFFVQGIPLIETVERLLDPRPLWRELIAERRRLLGRDTTIQRSFIARSDPALKAGMTAALVAAAVALARGRDFEDETGVAVPQIVGIGSAPFRGGLTPEPERLDRVLATYPGAATVTVQSAFRYDHPAEVVRHAVRDLGRRVERGWNNRARLPRGPDREETGELRKLLNRLKEAYEASFRELAPWLERIAPHVPSHRERYTQTALTGEVRRVGGLPAVRAIRFAASCYSLGVPPGALGFRVWDDLGESGRDLILRWVPRLEEWMREELRWAAPEPLPGLPLIAADLAAARTFAGSLDPDGEHAGRVAEIRRLLALPERLPEGILAAGRVRRFLG
ncbi:phosphoenolpyruvate carboxylase [Deferrisoma sp.]